MMRRRIFRPLQKRLNQMKKWRKTFSKCALQQNCPNMSPHGKGKQKYPRTWIPLRMHSKPHSSQMEFYLRVQS